jgi:hypothetical protein
MIKKIHKSAVVMMLLFGLLFVTSVPSVMAQGQCRKRGNYQSANYFGNRYDGDRWDNRDRDRNRRRSRDYDYYDYDRQDTTGKAVGRTAAGAGIGALGGALIGGKKGALIGAGIGAAGGYLYHRNKVNKDRDRYYRY